MCEFCGRERAIHNDHVVPKAVYKRLRGFDALYLPDWLYDTARSCGMCNWRKLTRLSSSPHRLAARTSRAPEP